MSSAMQKDHAGMTISEHKGSKLDNSVKDKHKYTNNDNTERDSDDTINAEMEGNDATSVTASRSTKSPVKTDVKMEAIHEASFTGYDLANQESTQTDENMHAETMETDITDEDVKLEDGHDEFIDEMDAENATTEDESEEAVSDEEEELPVDERCKAQEKCVAGSGDYRKVVSHIFGRNKKCTRGLPENAWILWCRKHYQRFRYRAEDDGNWHLRQLELVRNQLDEFERLSDVPSWEIVLRKAEQCAIDVENARIAAAILAAVNPNQAVTVKVENGEDTSKISTVGTIGEETVEATVVTESSKGGARDVKGKGKLVAPAGTPSAGNKPKLIITFPVAAREGKNTVNDAATALFPDASKASSTSSAILVHATSPLTSTTKDEILDGEALPLTPRPLSPYSSSPFSSPPPSDLIDMVARSPSPPPARAPVHERFLLPHLGRPKTYAQVRACLSRIETEFHTPAFQARAEAEKTFPGVEFLPNWADKRKGGDNGGEGASKRRRVGAGGSELGVGMWAGDEGGMIPFLH